MEWGAPRPRAARGPGRPEGVAEAGPGDETAASDEEEIGEVEQAGARTALDWRFRLLGSFADLAGMSQRWASGDTSDAIVFKLTGIGLVQQGISDGLSDANIRAVSIVKSASRSKRLTPQFTEYRS